MFYALNNGYNFNDAAYMVNNVYHYWNFPVFYYFL